MAVSFHWKLVQIQARSFLQILNGFLIGFTLGGSDCYRVAGRAYINRMRLSTDQIQAICQAATTAFGQGTSVWLFGSRVDDAKRGGDIDLLVCPQVRSADDAARPQQTFMQKIKMLTLLERQLDERQIDIVVEQAQDMRPIVAVAYKTGIKLQ